MTRHSRRRWTLLVALPAVLACADPEASAGPGGTPAELPPLVGAMYAALPAYIASERASLTGNGPANPHLTTQFQAKLAVLASPTLVADIMDGGRFHHTTARTPGGVDVPAAVVFMLEPMRGEAGGALDIVTASLPTLERFLDVPFPATTIRVWYGFTIGNRGGGGSIFTEDRTTYEARRTPTMMPYDPILAHELAHSYFGSESVTQWLELYVHNVNAGRGTAVGSWTFTRSYVPDAPGNVGVHALLDIYRIIGHDAMARALRRLYPLRPAYGTVLTAAGQQVFVDEAPAQARVQVAALAAKVTT